MSKKVKQESSYKFFDKSLDKERSFSANKETMVFSLIANEIESLEVLDEETDNLFRSSKAVDLEEGFAIVDVSDEEFSDTDSLIESNAYLKASIPSMIDEENNVRYFMPDQFTVQFNESVPKEKIESIISSHKSRIIKEQRTAGYYVLGIPDNSTLFETINRFNEIDEVLFAEASEIGIDDDLYTPDDTDFGKLWGLRNIGQVVDGVRGSIDSDIDAPLAWNNERGKKHIIVAVIDTGVDYLHPDLKDNIMNQGSEDWNFASVNSKDPIDLNGHGTHVAGTIGAVDNRTGVIGVAPNCTIMPLKVNLRSGMNANRADAINYVANQARKNKNNRYVINCSWKMSGHHSGVMHSISRAIAYNVVVIFSSGNAGRDTDIRPQYPAAYDKVIAVSATNQRDEKSSFSNYGKNVDVSAPGVNIYSTIPNSRYAYYDGTSMAAPHVAGLAALILSKNDRLSNLEVRQIIENTADNIDSKNPNFVGRLGKGRINAYRALLSAPSPSIFTTDLVGTIKYPQLNHGSSTGLAYANSIQAYPVPWFKRTAALLFVTQKAYSERIYLINPVTGITLRSFDPPSNDTLGSLAWDGDYIYGANVTWGSGRINKLSPITGKVVASFRVPAGRGEGLSAHGSYLYYSTVNRVYKIRKNDGTIVHSFPAPNGQCHAIASGDGYLFFGNTATGVITILRANNLSEVSNIEVPGGRKKRVDALAYNSHANLLYVANQVTNEIYVLKLKS